MPEPFVPGYYSPGTNNTGFLTQQTYPNFSQPAQWSTGNSNQPPPPPQGFGYDNVNIPGPQTVTENQQFVTADQLFSQNTSPYQNTFSAAPYLNGSMGNWSYFNNPNSFFFPTGNGDLNLSWGAATATENAGGSMLYDIYKPPPPPQDQEKLDNSPNNDVVNSGFENSEVNGGETIEHALSNLTIMKNENDVIETHLQPNTDQTILNSVSCSMPVKPIQMDSVNDTISSSVSHAPAKPVSWAAVASQPAKSKPPPQRKAQQTKPFELPAPSGAVKVGGGPSQNGSNGSKDTGKMGFSRQNQSQQPNRWHNKQGNGASNYSVDNTVAHDNDSHLDINKLKDKTPLLKKLMAKYNFNPREFKLDFENCCFFIIKSYSEDDIFRSIKYSSWTSTEHGNRRLNDRFKDLSRTTKGPIYMLFSVNSSGHFCGVAQMMSEVDINVETGIWVQDKWKGRFDVKWIYVKDVPNSALRHIKLENNEGKPVTNSRDTQEVPPEKGKQILKIIHNYRAQTSIFDDFPHYEKRQEEDAKMRSKKMPEPDL